MNLVYFLKKYFTQVIYRWQVRHRSIYTCYLLLFVGIIALY